MGIIPNIGDLTEKTTPADADVIIIEDSEDSGNKKKVQLVNLPSGGGTPGGSDTQVQFNDSGAFAGDDKFLWDNTNERLWVGDTYTLPTVYNPRQVIYTKPTSIPFNTNYYQYLFSVYNHIDNTGSLSYTSAGTGNISLSLSNYAMKNSITGNMSLGAYSGNSIYYYGMENNVVASDTLNLVEYTHSPGNYYSYADGVTRGLSNSVENRITITGTSNSSNRTKTYTCGMESSTSSIIDWNVSGSASYEELNYSYYGMTYMLSNVTSGTVTQKNYGSYNKIYQLSLNDPSTVLSYGEFIEIKDGKISGSVMESTGIWIDYIQGAVKRGIVLNQDGAGGDIVFGAGQDSRIYYDGTNLHIDAALVGSGTIILDNLPTSSAGLPTGAVWNNSNVLNIV